MYFDGASNSKGAGVGAVVISKDGMHFSAYSKLNFDATNNVSEYEACILCLRLALVMDIRRLAVFGDFKLVIKQSTEEYAMRDAKLIPYRRCLVDLYKTLTTLSSITFPEIRTISLILSRLCHP